MGKKVTLKVYMVPEENAEMLSVEFQKMAFRADPTYKKIMEAILENQDKKAEEIRWHLKYTHKINRNKQTIINMAKKIGVELKK